MIIASILFNHQKTLYIYKFLNSALVVNFKPICLPLLHDNTGRSVPSNNIKTAVTVCACSTSAVLCCIKQAFCVVQYVLCVVLSDYLIVYSYCIMKIKIILLLEVKLIKFSFSFNLSSIQK